jgi:hypothetical protein
VVVSTVKQWVVHFSSGDSDVKDKRRSRWPCTAVTLRNEERLDQLTTWIGRLRLGNCVWSWISASMCWKRWWQRWNIAKFATGRAYECSNRNMKNTVCKFVRTYWTNTRLKVTVSWITSSPLRATVKTAVHGVATCEFPIEEKVQDAALSG